MNIGANAYTLRLADLLYVVVMIDQWQRYQRNAGTQACVTIQPAIHDRSRTLHKSAHLPHNDGSAAAAFARRHVRHCRPGFAGQAKPLQPALLTPFQLTVCLHQSQEQCMHLDRALPSLGTTSQSPPMYQLLLLLLLLLLAVWNGNMCLRSRAISRDCRQTLTRL